MDLKKKMKSLEKLTTLPRVSASELKEPHKVLNIKKVHTKYGQSILIEVSHNDERVVVYLPSRFATELDEEDINNIRSNNFYIKCTGVTGRSPDIELFIEKNYKKKVKIHFINEPEILRFSYLLQSL